MTTIRPPVHRRLRVFAFDPSLALRLETSSIREIELEIPWETSDATGASSLRPGPVGGYVEVVDHDPASGLVYAPVDLDHPHLLAQRGHSPSEGNPQFHQQMVYAVAMNTISTFERALGRVALWATRIVRDDGEDPLYERYVQRLRIYPHALREANAYYDPAKKALLFGYFPDPVTGTMVFTCLSQDIVAHETTHALLDGLHPRFREATNGDVLALHEAFADIVGMLQRFSNAAALRHQIARTRGDLAGQNLLGQLAQQFGRAIGRRSALRDALGRTDENGVWHPHVPDPAELARTTAPHARGAILVAAVFDAFLQIYRSRIADLLRIASQGTGVLPPGDLHPDLVERMADEAADAAAHVLRMCIRALDYCPPVDVDFGDYLRALITADADLYPDDGRGYRVAVIDAFRRRGILPAGVRSLAEDALLWPTGDEVLLDHGACGAAPARRDELKGDFSTLGLSVDWNLGSDRERAWDRMEENAGVFHAWLVDGAGRKHAAAFGLVLDEDAPPSVNRARDGRPAVEVHSVRTAQRRGPRGALLTELVVEITQTRRAWYDPAIQAEVDGGDAGDGRAPDFRFRRGCTLLIDPETMEARRVIRTAGTVADDAELARVRRFLAGEDPDPESAFAGGPRRLQTDEDFARLHRR